MRKFYFIYPKSTDVRWILLAFLFSYALFALQSTSFTRNLEQLLFSFFSCLIVDLIFLSFKRIPIIPLSSVITSIGVLLLCDSPNKWIFSLVAIISITSKHLIKNGTRHIFNPNNFGIVVGVLYFPAYMTTTMGRWGGSIIGAAIVGILGILVVIKAKRLALSLSYFATFLVGIFARCFLLKRAFLVIAAPITGAAFQLFIFYMLTDPATTPKSKSHQIMFGISLGVLDTFFRFYQVKYAPFFSLFIICACYAFIEERSKNTKIERPWSLRTVNLSQFLNNKQYSS